MAVTVETLEKLERKITLSLSVDTIRKEVDARLKKLQRQVRMDGFRPGKVPMNVVAQQYGYSVQYEVMNDKVGEAFASAAGEAQLRVAGAPKITEKSGAPDGEVQFDAVFEVYPEVTFKDFADVEIEKLTAEVSDAAIDKTVEILRKQRRTFAQRAADAAAAEGDRVTIDFEGTVDGEPFDGGQASDFQFILGDGQMLKEFEDGVRGMKVGESKTTPVSFPDDYHGKDVAGKTADFMLRVKKIEAQHLPDINEALAKQLGINPATVEALRADVKKNLEREVKFRLISRNKAAVMDAVVANCELDLPKSSVEAEVERLRASAFEDLSKRGMKGLDASALPNDIFQPQAERRVRLGLAVADLVNKNGLHAKPEQIRAYVEELAASYEKPAEVVRWYYGDNARMAEAEAVIIENNVTEFVLSKAKSVDKPVSFEELMGQQQ
jgi:trigger factor